MKSMSKKFAFLRAGQDDVTTTNYDLILGWNWRFLVGVERCNQHHRIRFHRWATGHLSNKVDFGSAWTNKPALLLSHRVLKSRATLPSQRICLYSVSTFCHSNLAQPSQLCREDFHFNRVNFVSGRETIWCRTNWLCHDVCQTSILTTCL